MDKVELVEELQEAIRQAKEERDSGNSDAVGYIKYLTFKLGQIRKAKGEELARLIDAMSY